MARGLDKFCQQAKEAGASGGGGRGGVLPGGGGGRGAGGHSWRLATRRAPVRLALSQEAAPAARSAVAGGREAPRAARQHLVPRPQGLCTPRMALRESSRAPKGCARPWLRRRPAGARHPAGGDGCHPRGRLPARPGAGAAHHPHHAAGEGQRAQLCGPALGAGCAPRHRSGSCCPRERWPQVFFDRHPCSRDCPPPPLRSVGAHAPHRAEQPGLCLPCVRDRWVPAATPVAPRASAPLAATTAWPAKAYCLGRVCMALPSVLAPAIHLAEGAPEPPALLAARAGVTGARVSIESRVEGLISQLQEVAEGKAVCVGFGVSGPEQVRGAAWHGLPGMGLLCPLVRRHAACNSLANRASPCHPPPPHSPHPPAGKADQGLGRRRRHLRQRACAGAWRGGLGR